jgi:hypothetical protein
MSDRNIEIVVGCALILLGLLGRRFAWGGFGASRRENALSLPIWLGRALFIVGGCWFIYMAVKGTK